MGAGDRREDIDDGATDDVVEQDSVTTFPEAVKEEGVGSRNRDELAGTGELVVAASFDF